MTKAVRVYNCYGFMQASFPPSDSRDENFTGEGEADMFISKQDEVGPFLFVFPVTRAANMQKHLWSEFEKFSPSQRARVRYASVEKFTMTMRDIWKLCKECDAHGVAVDTLVLLPKEKDALKKQGFQQQTCLADGSIVPYNPMKN